MRTKQLGRDLEIHTIKGEIMKRMKKTIGRIEKRRNTLIKESTKYEEDGECKLKRSRKALPNVA